MANDQRKSRTTLGCETLESREVPAALGPPRPDVKFDSTNGALTITVSEDTRNQQDVTLSMYRDTKGEFAGQVQLNDPYGKRDLILGIRAADVKSITINGSRQGNTIDLRQVSARGGFTQNLNDHVTINAGAGNDTVSGSQFSDVINGGDGNDQLHGQDGSDKLNGERDNDTLYGEGGNNTLSGGSGKDSFSGSVAGYDIVTDYNVAIDFVTKAHNWNGLGIDEVRTSSI